MRRIALLVAPLFLLFYPLSTQATQVEESSFGDNDSNVEMFEETRESVEEESHELESVEETLSSVEVERKEISELTGNSNETLDKTVTSEESLESFDKSSFIRSNDWSVEELQGYQTPSPKGISLVIPLRSGFIVQPPSEQYILENEIANLDIAAVFWVLGHVKVNVHYWELEDSGVWSNKKKYGTVTSKESILSPLLKEAYIPITGLKEGKYIFQLEIKTGILISKYEYYSHTAYVEVKKIPVNAIDLKIETPQVVFEKAMYRANANTTPEDATTSIEWSSELDSLLKFMPESGRNTNFYIENKDDVINTHVDYPGIPFKVSAIALNRDNTKLTTENTLFLGGLSAKNVAQDSGMEWEVNQQGLIDLEETIEINEEDKKPWKYTWKYASDEKEPSKELPSNNRNGVRNSSGVLNNLSELNNPTNILTFEKDSQFMQEAHEATKKGRPFIFQVSFETEIPVGDQNKLEKIVINSNRAQLKVTAPNGKLKLEAVPNFYFQSISPGYIYSGSQPGELISEPSKLIVKDTRYKGKWSLDVQMTSMTSSLGTVLMNTGILIPLGDKKIQLMDNQTDVEVWNSTLGKEIDFDVQGQLILGKTPNAILHKNEQFSSELKWTLLTGSPETKKL